MLSYSRKTLSTVDRWSLFRFCEKVNRVELQIRSKSAACTGTLNKWIAKQQKSESWWKSIQFTHYSRLFPYSSNDFAKNNVDCNHLTKLSFNNRRICSSGRVLRISVQYRVINDSSELKISLPDIVPILDSEKHKLGSSIWVGMRMLTL